MDEKSREIDLLVQENHTLRCRIAELERKARHPTTTLINISDASIATVPKLGGVDDPGEDYSFADLVDIPRLQALLDTLYEATNIPTAVVAADTTVLTKSGWQDVCVKFHRACPATEKLCKESDAYISDHLGEGPFVSYRCKNGLLDYACPLVVGGRHLATLFTGQLLLQPPDEEFFRSQARMYGFDEEAYLEAVYRVPVLPEEQMPKTLALLVELAGTLVDIGSASLRERMHARRALSESENRFRVAFEQANIGMVLSEIDGSITKVNQALIDMLGYSEAELLSTDWGSLTHPDDVAAITDYLPLLLAGERDNFRVESRYLHKDGHIVWAAVAMIIVRNDEGQPQYFMSHVIDISEQKHSDMLLREAMNRLEEAQRVARLGSWEWDTVNDVITGSPEFYRLFECAPRQLARLQDLVEVLHPEDVERVQQEVSDALERRYPYHTEYRVRRMDNPWRYIEARGVISYDDRDQPVRMIGTCMDITERKTAERRAEEEERKARAFLDGTRDMVTVVDPEGRLLYVNASASKFLGGATGEFIGKRMFDFAHPDDMDTTQRSFEGWIREKVSWASLENRLVSKDGRVLHALWTIMPQFRNGELFEIWSIARDITERKGYEEELKMLNNSLARSNQELEQFAYVASHDLQEPLRMVSSYTQLLARRYQDQLDQDARDFIDFAVDGANRMQRLIQDLLSFSRVTTRGQPMKNLDVHDALGEAVHNLQAAIQESGALVSNSELPWILGDSTQISMIFQNLIGNAIKFHKPDEPPRVHVSARRDAARGGFWVLSVQDNGIGIETRHFDRLFVIFQRLHGKQDYPGTGIGLALCKRIVERHGGNIWLESEAGVGTTFFFTLPSAESNERG